MPSLVFVLLCAGSLTANGPPDKLAKHREVFDRKVTEQREKAGAAFTQALNSLRKINPRVMAAPDRDRLIKQVEPELKEFQKTGRMTAALSGHEAAQTYLAQVRLAAKELADRTKDLLEGRKPGDVAYDEVNRLDLFQPQTVWDGVRIDKPQPGQVQRAVNPFNVRHSRYHIRGPGGVGKTDWDLHVTSRSRDEVKLEVVQAGGKAKWQMVGTFDGFNLLASNRMLPGAGMLEGAAPRLFDYKGYVVGDGAALDFEGVRADGKPTVGFVSVTLRR